MGLLNVIQYMQQRQTEVFFTLRCYSLMIPLYNVEAFVLRFIRTEYIWRNIYMKKCFFNGYNRKNNLWWCDKEEEKIDTKCHIKLYDWRLEYFLTESEVCYGLWHWNSGPAGWIENSYCFLTSVGLVSVWWLKALFCHCNTVGVALSK